MQGQTKKLGEVLLYEQPSKYIVNSKNYSSDYETPVLTAGKTFILGNTKEKENIFPVDKLPVIIFDDFTTAIQFVDFPFKVKSSAMKILHAKKSEADIRYLFYLIKTIKLNHVTHKRYWISEYSEIEISLPSVSKQRKIVAKLEKKLAKIKEAKRLRAEAQELTQNLLSVELHKIFAEGKKNGWEEKEFIDVVAIESKRNTKNLPYVGMEDVESGTGKFLGNKEVRKVKSSTSYFNMSHILYGKLRPYLNKVLMPDFEGHCTTEFLPLKPDAKYLSREWLTFWIKSEGVVSRINSTVAGARMPRANMNEVKKYKIPLPPLSEQKKIVARLDALSEKIKKLQEHQKSTMADLDRLEQSILHQAFNQK